MTFEQIQDSVIALRFHEGKRTEVKNWINTAYQKIWNEANWSFKKVRDQNFSITAGDSTPTMPTDLSKVTQITDFNGSPLVYIPDWQYDEAFAGDTATGVPQYYTVIDRQVHLAPIPSGNSTFKISYKRRLSHVDPVSGVVGGIMVEDGDQPIWAAEYDYVLVLEATIIGQQTEKDPNWRELQPQRDALLISMREDLTSDVSGQVLQWGG